MLAIRMQRTGRKSHAQFRVIVQDSRRTPTSGNIVAQIGNYDPHTKEITIDKEKASFYLSNGAQPSPRVIRILKQEKVKLPSWVIVPADRKSKIKNIEKLRKNRPAEEKREEKKAEETPAETPAGENAEAKPATEPVAEAEPESTEEKSAEVEEAEVEEAVAEESETAEDSAAAEEASEEPEVKK